MFKWIAMFIPVFLSYNINKRFLKLFIEWRKKEWMNDIPDASEKFKRNHFIIIIIILRCR